MEPIEAAAEALQETADLLRIANHHQHRWMRETAGAVVIAYLRSFPHNHQHFTCLGCVSEHLLEKTGLLDEPQ